jgi:hypothetical protein
MISTLWSVARSSSRVTRQDRLFFCLPRFEGLEGLEEGSLLLFGLLFLST